MQMQSNQKFNSIISAVLHKCESQQGRKFLNYAIQKKSVNKYKLQNKRNLALYILSNCKWYIEVRSIRETGVPASLHDT